MVARACEKIMVMYAGKIVETGPVEEVLKNPKHPYTKSLLNSFPKMDHSRSIPLISIGGSPPDPKKIPVGCSFKDRCPLRTSKCEKEPKGPVACWKFQ